MEIERIESRKYQTPNKRESSSTILLDQRGLGTREEEERNPHSFIQHVMERMKVGRKEIRSHYPNPPIGHHDRATKLAQGYP
jgi:hypothetical protein